MRHLVIEIMQKAARCWSGYEPVPGAKAYSEGSCRPKGSKKTKKEVIQGKDHKEKKASGPGGGSFTLGSHQVPTKVTYGAPMSPDMVNQVRAIAQQHAGYKKNPLAADTDVHRAALHIMKNPTGNARLVGQLNQAGISGLDNFPGMPLPKPVGAPQPAPVQAPQAPQQTAATAVKPPQPQAPVTSPAPAPPPASSLQRPKARQMQANPVPAIDARLQRKGVDPSKPVFAKAAPTPPVTPKIVQNVTNPAATQPKKPTDFFSGSTPNVNGIADQVREYQRLLTKGQGNIK
jgi:hypothetical protein